MNDIPKIKLGKTIVSIFQRKIDDRSGKETIKLINSGIIFDVCYSQEGEPSFIRIYNHTLKTGEGNYQSLKEYYPIKSKNCWTEFNGEIKRSQEIDLRRLIGNF